MREAAVTRANLPANSGFTDLAAFQRFVTEIDDPEAGGRKVVSPFRQLVSVFRGMLLSAQTLAAVPFGIRDRETKEPVLANEKGPRGELVARLLAPHPGYTWESWIQTFVLQHFGGQSFALPLGRGINGVPDRIKILHPSRMQPDRQHGDDPDDMEFWIYTAPSGKTAKIPVSRVMQLKYAPDIDGDPFKGSSPFQPGQVQMDAEYLAGVYQRSAMRNGGAPGAILTLDTGDDDQEVDPEWKRQVEEEWNRKFSIELQGSNKIALLTKKWAYQVLGFAPKDMEYLGLRNWSIGDFARMLNIPPLYLGLYENSGLSDAGLKVQKQLLYEINTIPLGSNVSSVFNVGYVWPVDPSLEAYFDFSQVEALRGDIATRITEAKAFIDMGFTLDQVNEKYGFGFDLRKSPWAKESFCQSSLTTRTAILDGIANPQPKTDPRVEALLQAHEQQQQEKQKALPKTPNPEEPQKDESQVQDAVTRSLKAIEEKLECLTKSRNEMRIDDRQTISKSARKRRSLSNEIKAHNLPGVIKRHQQKFLDVHDEATDSLDGVIRRAIMGFRSRVLKKIEALASKQTTVKRAVGKDVTFALPPDEIGAILDEISDAELLAAMEPKLRSAYRKGAATNEELLAQMGVPIKDLTDFQAQRLPQLVDGYIDKRLGTGLPTAVNDEIRDAVNQEIIRGIQEGKNLRDVMTDVRGVFNASIARSRVIATTEVGIAMNSARYALAEENGVDQNIWLTCGDSHVRETHQQLANVIAPMGESFLPDVDLKYPGDPDCDDPSLVINCRCTLAPMSRRMRIERLTSGEAKTNLDLAREMMEENLAAAGE